jgi:uncharacterized protein (DUF1810 family)
MRSRAGIELSASSEPFVWFVWFVVQSLPRRHPRQTHRPRLPMPYDLARFTAAQAPVIEAVRAELAAGEKRSHWMWFVFPQIAGLGSTDMARRYAIVSLDEARAYLADPVLGPRLVELTALVNGVEGRTVHEIFGSPDDLKFRSSMTLFAEAGPEEPAFRGALEKYYAGAPDPRTLEILRA